MDKVLEKFGVASRDYETKEHAMSDTYTTRDGRWVTTPFACNDNPYSQEFLNAKNVLDIGCGCGRNLRWFMENTNAHYWGLDPNATQLQYFWELNDTKWKDRVSLMMHFNQLPLPLFDVVVSTFVFMHIGFRPPEGVMNVVDITKEVMKHTVNGCVWFLWEHDGEEKWIDYWAHECNIPLETPPNVYMRNYSGKDFDILTHRNNLVPDRTGHHLMIFKEEK